MLLLLLATCVFIGHCNTSIFSRSLYTIAPRPDFGLRGTVPRLLNTSFSYQQDVLNTGTQQDAVDKTRVAEQSVRHSSQFLAAVQVGRCKAKCRLLFSGPELEKTRSDPGFLIETDCRTSAKCRTCELACELPPSECNRQCRSVGLSFK